MIVGGGISGLSSAVHLIELSQKKNSPIELLLLESSPKLGGVISSLKTDDCLLETGPDAIFTEKPHGIDFCKKIGLENELIGTNPNCRSSFIAMNNKLFPVPEGFYLLAPAKIFPLITTSIFTWRGKLRALCELFIPAKKDVQDESLASFVRRRLGKEVLERMAQPMVAGIYSADPEELSLQATFPRFLEWEKMYGSVIRGLWSVRKKSNRASTRGPRYELFVSFKQGMQSLIDKITTAIPKESVRLGAKVKEIVSDSGAEQRYKIRGENFAISADAVCLATPAYQSAKMVKLLDKNLSLELEKISYASGITVNLIYKKEDIAFSLNGFGFVVPAIEKKTISGCTFGSVKFLGRAPKDKVILRAFIGGKQCENMTRSEDKEIESLIKKDLKEILGLEAEPYFSQVHRHPYSLPQYCVGHLEIVKKIEEHLQHFPGLAFAGNGYYGTGIPDCIHSSELAAEKLLNSLLINPPIYQS